MCVLHGGMFWTVEKDSSLRLIAIYLRQASRTTQASASIAPSGLTERLTIWSPSDNPFFGASLIESGGGTGPKMPQQPAPLWVLVLTPAGCLQLGCLGR